MTNAAQVKPKPKKSVAEKIQILPIHANPVGKYLPHLVQLLGIHQISQGCAKDWCRKRELLAVHPFDKFAFLNILGFKLQPGR